MINTWEMKLILTRIPYGFYMSFKEYVFERAQTLVSIHGIGTSKEVDCQVWLDQGAQKESELSCSFFLSSA